MYLLFSEMLSINENDNKLFKKNQNQNFDTCNNMCSFNDIINLFLKDHNKPLKKKKK